MAATSSLAERIQAEFKTREAKVKTRQNEQAQASSQREQRLDLFAKTCEKLKEVWRPRLDEFTKQFGDKIKATPTVTPSQREAKMVFMTDLASVNLTLSASADSDVQNLVLDYNLQIIPVFMEYERHSRLSMPLDKIDSNAVGAWVEDRLVTFVRTYLSMEDNQHYMERRMVTDPISEVKFQKDAAAATLQHNSRTQYFATTDTLAEFKKRHQIKE